MILVTGGTGFVGRRLVRSLGERGLKMRILLSSKSRPEVLPEGDYELASGDITDPDSMLEAMEGVHTVIHLVGTDTRGRHARLWEIDVPGTQAIVDAALEARVGRMITISRPGSSKASAYQIHQAKGEIEQIVRSSGLAYTIFQTSTLFGEGDRFSEHIAMLASGSPAYVIPGEGEMVVQPLWVEDLVRCIVLSLDDLNLIDQTVSLGGPELLTYRRAVLRVMAASGIKRPIVSMPFLVVRAGAWFLDGLFARWPFTEFWVELLAANQTAELGTIERTFGFRPAAFDLGLIDSYLQKKGYLWRLIRYSLTLRW